jgi:hypothetical protein
MSGNGIYELALLDQAKQALSEASSFDEIKDIRDKAEAVRKYAQSAALGLDVQNRAAEVKLRAERRAGVLLSQLMLRGGDRRSKSRDDRLKLDDLGISRNQSTRWQIQAKVPENIFCNYVRDTCDAGKELTSATLMRVAKEWGGRESLRSNGHVKNGHLHNGLARTAPARFRQSASHSPAAKLDEMVGELKNHFQVLTGVLEPVIESENGISLKVAERRILQYLLSEMNQLLKQLNHFQRTAFECSCADDRRKSNNLVAAAI